MKREGGREGGREGHREEGGRLAFALLYKWVVCVRHNHTHTHAERIENRETPATTTKSNHALAVPF